MIQETINRKHLPALTSDHWHVVLARWSGDKDGKPNFLRSIVSEHEDRASATAAAREAFTALAPAMADRPRKGWDQVFVRKPEYKSLKSARRVSKRRK